MAARSLGPGPSTRLHPKGPTEAPPRPSPSQSRGSEMDRRAAATSSLDLPSLLDSSPSPWPERDAHASRATRSRCSCPSMASQQNVSHALKVPSWTIFRVSSSQATSLPRGKRCDDGPAEPGSAPRSFESRAAGPRPRCRACCCRRQSAPPATAGPRDKRRSREKENNHG